MRSTRRGRLVLAVLLLAAFSLITLDYRTGALEGVRGAASTVFGPIEDGVSDVTHPIGSWFSGIGHLGSYKSENKALQNEVASLKSQLHLTQGQRTRLMEDEKLLHLAGLGGFTVVAARVTAYGGALDTEDTVTLDRGRVDGIKVDETVIAPDGLAGRVIHVGRSTSTVLLANDPTFSVGARLEGKQLELGHVDGGGLNSALTLELLSNSVPLKVGENLVTAGDPNNTPFVPEVPIGSITQVKPTPTGLAQTALVKAFVDFTSLDMVMVVTKAPPNIKRDSLLPTSPTPAPTVTVTVTTPPGGTGTPNPGGSTSTTP